MFVPFVQYLYHKRTIIAILGLPKLFGETKALDFGVVFGIFGGRYAGVTPARHLTQFFISAYITAVKFSKITAGVMSI